MKKLLFLLALAPLTIPMAPARAQAATATASTEVEAMALLDKSAAAYAALEGLSMRYSSFDEQGAKTSSASGTVEFAKSGGARITSSLSKQAIIRGAAPDAESAKKSLEGAMRQVPSAVSLVLPSLVQGKNPLTDGVFAGVKSAWSEVRLLPDNGVAATLKASSALEPEGYGIECAFYFDPTDNLLRRVEAKAQIKGKTFRSLTSLTDLQINPQFAPETFALPKAAPGAAIPPAERSYFDPKLKLGAVPYALTGADLTGKMVSLPAYKGKVVLLDFWATWCGPCVGELPNVLSSYQKHRAQGFEIIGISLDDDKKALTDFVKARKMTWPQLFDGQGWKNVNGTRYGVRAIPFTLLIGKDGKIAAVNPRGDELEPAIVAALRK